MRYLNRIIFINSAQIKYAEINLDGNVHFIGTQGVGKSTLLRAILFFYNADTFGLGIPKQKESYTDYYYKDSNSYIIYEVERKEGKFCVVSYKSQHKVCFRFFDGAYKSNYFVSESGNVPENWEGIAQQLDLHKIFYTKRKIDEHKEYRDILYGNHDRKKHELKKYSILESKDYQYIPKTIQNVFLNSKMDAEVIKQTIIMSLENDIRIDLNQHAHHLSGFDAQLADIRKFKTPVTTAQAISISKLHLAIRHLEREEVQLVKELVWAYNRILEEEPEVQEKCKVQRITEANISGKLKKIKDSFDIRKGKLNGDIHVQEDKLKHAKKLSEDYEKIGINNILERVGRKPQWEKETKFLTEENELLTTQFKEIGQKFQALLDKLENQKNDFLNGKNSLKNIANSDFLTFKDETNQLSEKAILVLKTEHEVDIENARNDWENKKQLTQTLKLKKEELKHKRFFEKEIEELRKLVEKFEKDSFELNSRMGDSSREIESLEKQWGYDEKDLQKSFEREKEKLDGAILLTINKQTEIATYIENSKGSLYGWLAEQYPGWENTIGKVIDEDKVLFNTFLSPKLSGKSNSFYGVELNLDEISKTVKTVEDYEKERLELVEKIDGFKLAISELSKNTEKGKANLKKKYQPKIRELKSVIKENEYVIEQNILKQGEAQVSYNGFITNAEVEKKKAIENIDKSIEEAAEIELNAKNEVIRVEGELIKLIKAKEREKEKKIAVEQEKLNQLIQKIEIEINAENEAYKKRKNEINVQKENELAKKGADTNRITEIEKRLEELKSELAFIEENREKVSDYKKDKREYLDKVVDFKNLKASIEKQLLQEVKKYSQQKEIFNNDLEIVISEITLLSQTLTQIKEDKADFEEFKLLQLFTSFQEYFTNSSEGEKSEKRVKKLIDEIKDTHFNKLISRIDDLRKTTTDFLGKFTDENIFKFKKQLTDTKSFLDFASMLSDFIEENKIERIEKEVNERFALIITTIGKQTSSLIAESGKIQSVIKKINDDFVARNFGEVIKKIELKVDDSKNEIVQLLILIKKYNDENAFEFGETNLFSSESQEKKNKDAVDLLKQFVKKINELKKDYISLSDSFELKFRIEENQNDTGWVEKLSNVGSDGTDVLVKAMVNIMLLNVFKEGASKRFKDFRLHCMMDEIGKLHPTNVRGILKFANDRNILLINSSPIENDALAFNHIYKLKKDEKSITRVNRIITQFSEG